tara:strand:- start:1152 stop:2231 length:1080 start_codon:yes stop_codon:yes gene_type:complete
MTTFFDPKEEVLDIQLTPYGEALLSVGDFKPVYYAFFDDNILYDASGSAGVTEVQNDIETRIQENTPRTKVQAVFSGIESNLAPLIGQVRYGGAYEPGRFGLAGGPASVEYRRRFLSYEALPPNTDQNYTFVEPLGTMQLGSKNAPAWNIRVLNGELSGAINYLTSSTEAGLYNNVRRVPQLDFDLTYRVRVGNTSQIDINGAVSRENRVLSRVYDDGSFLYLEQDALDIIVAVDEENSSIDLEYDIEVFEIKDETDSEGSPVLAPLNFLRPTTKILNGVLLDEEIPLPSVRIDRTFAEYFFLVNTDREIPSEEICPVLGDLRTRGITLNDIPYDCTDVQEIGRFDIYDTNAVEDPCDD